jgi:transmembrane sensor
MALVSDISAEIRAEAAVWLARLRADDKSRADEAAFRLWLTKDERHATAFEAVTELWEVAGAAWNEPIAMPVPRTNRRALLASVGSLAAAGVVAAVWQSATAGIYQTGVGEQKHAVLPDGSHVFLDTDSKIRLEFDRHTRNVTMERGRCNFHVRESDARPFMVDTTVNRIITRSSTFDVRRDGMDVCVVLTQGVAAIKSVRGGPQHALKAGDRLVESARKIRLDRPNLAPLLAWQTGQAIFDNETVTSAIREMNRYSEVKIAVDDATVGNLRLSGVYRVGDNAAFAHSIATLLPVILNIETNQVRLELDPARANRT